MTSYTRSLLYRMKTMINSEPSQLVSIQVKSDATHVKQSTELEAVKSGTFRTEFPELCENWIVSSHPVLTLEMIMTGRKPRLGCHCGS